jgi:hypothetical protein
MEESAEVGETDEENGKGIKCKWMKQNEESCNGKCKTRMKRLMERNKTRTMGLRNKCHTVKKRVGTPLIMILIRGNGV